ncbi:hypothetical protein RB595_007222 [Gaeumannomyces hyphopodioides]
MPMPRTKVQGLGAHVSSMANSARGYVFGNGDRSSQQSKSLKGGAGLLGDDSSSDSSSSDSDSEISDAEGTQSFLSKINAATTSKKAKASESATNSSATKSAPGGTPKPKAVESARKNGTKTIGKSPAVSSSQHKIAAAKKDSAKDDSDTTSSDSSSEEDDARAKNLKQTAEPTAAKVKPDPQDDSTSSDSSSSDDSDSEVDKKSAPYKSNLKKSVPAPREDSSSSESSDSDEGGDEAKDAGAKLGTKGGKEAASLAKTGDDSSSESDSESEEEVANAKNSKPRATKVPAQVPKPTKVATKETTKKAAPTSGSESGSDSESSEDEDNQNLETKATPRRGAASAVPNGSVKSKDASSLAKALKVPNVAAEESSSEDDSDVEMADESFALARTDDADPGAVEEFVREGFQLRKASENTQANEVLEMFKKAKREGKQIWYFTTPASVPISVIERMEFPMKNAQTGDSIVSHDGVDYGVDLGASGKPSTFQILVPAKKGASYGIVDRPVDHTMHLKRITQLAATDFTAKPKPQNSYSKPPRPQPADLKRRFTPIGVPTPILPPPVPNPSKRSRDVAMVDTVSEGKGENQESSKKPKKRKLAEDAVKASKEEKKSKRAKTASEEQVAKINPGASLSNSQPVKKASPVPLPNPGGRAPSFSQPTPSAAASVSTPATDKSKKSKSGEKANGTSTPSGKPKRSKKSKLDASIRQTPIPIPTIPGMKK